MTEIEAAVLGMQMRSREVNLGLIGLKLACLAKSNRTEIHHDLPKSPRTSITTSDSFQNDHSVYSLLPPWISSLTDTDG